MPSEAVGEQETEKGQRGDAMILTKEQIDVRKSLPVLPDEQDYIDTIEAARQERDEWCETWLKRAKMLEQVANDLRSELTAWREGGLSEEILRRGDGTIKVGKGCRFVYEQYVEDTDAEINALKDSLEWAKVSHPFSSRACPLCTHEYGLYQYPCSFHQEIEALKARGK